MAVKEIGLSDNANRLTQRNGGLLVGQEKQLNLDAATPAPGELPMAAGDGGQNMIPSGITAGVVGEVGSLLSMAAFVDSDPVAPADKDAWFRVSAGAVYLKYKIGGTVYAVQLH